MAEETVSPKNVSDLIDYLIKAKDPAVVGLRRILKKKADMGRDFPLHEMTLEELGTGKEVAGKIFTETEQRILELEKTVLKLQQQLAGQKKNAEKAVKDAFTRGQQEGFLRGEKTSYEKARSEYDRQIKAIEEKLVTVLKNVGESRKALLSEAQKTVLDISSAIALKIINTEISLNPDIILSVIKKALSYIVDRQEFIVRVSPEDLETVTRKKDFWTSIAERLDRVTVEPDNRIEKGGCIIESNTGVADARINVQFEELLDVIDTTWESMMTSLTAAETAEEQTTEAEAGAQGGAIQENGTGSGDAAVDFPESEDTIDDTPASPEQDIQDNPDIPG